MSEVKVVTTDTFQEEVLNADKPVLVDFWAVWCGPCKMLAPIVAEIAQEYEGKVKVGKVNVDDEPALAGRFGISSIPTLILFKNGQQAAVSVGVRPKEELVQMLQ